MSKGAFNGIKVLDFCWVVIGPMTTRYFSDYGATVVRVESAHRPDVLRNGEPFAGGEPGIDRSGYYANYNSGKLSIALNMAFAPICSFLYPDEAAVTGPSTIFRNRFRNNL